MSAAAKFLKGLVSKADEAAAALKREKGTGAEFLRELEKTPGVKPAEIKDRRLDKILPAMGKTTKAEVKKVLDQNPPPRIEETVLGEENAKVRWFSPKSAEAAGLDRSGYAVVDQRGKVLDGPYDSLSKAEGAIESMGNVAAPAKYGEYQIPGGENYREILLKLPPEGPTEAQARTIVGDKMWDRMTPEQRREFMSYPTDAAKKEVYRSSHWNGEPNVLAHARVSDRTGPNGERILHIEEIQSDWHQAGRKKGYQTPEMQAEIEAMRKAKTKAKSELNEIQKSYDEAKEFSRSLDAKIASPDFALLPPEKQVQFRESAKSWGEAWLSKLPELMKAREAYEGIPDAAKVAGEMVPDAPFKKSWHELTMKRLLNYAAENNYDRIAVTPGVDQFKRYGSERIDWQKNPEGGWSVTSTEQSGGIHQGQNIEDLARERGVLLESRGLPVNSKEQLENIIGFSLAREHSKEQIQKLTDRIWTRMQTESEGTSMPRKEGLEGFYDKILPDYLNSLGKPYGASVGRMEIPKPPANSMDVSGFPLGEEYIQGRATWSEFLAANPDAASKFSTPLHSFDITPQMRQEITSKGLPLYSVPAIEGAAVTGAGAAALGATEEEKAPVYISDNPDTMRLELEDKQMAGGGLAKRLAEAVKAGRKMTAADEAAIRARGMGVPGVDFADPLAPPTMRMSEALGNVGAEGKVLNFTEADRSRVFGPNRGGVGFSALQLYSEPHKKAGSSWGFGNKLTAEKKIRQNKPGESLWTTFVGAPDQHKSNTVVIKDAIEDFQKSVKAGEVHPAQIDLMNQRLRSLKDEKTGKPLFDPDFNLTDPGALAAATTFSRRSGIGDVLLGTGVKGEMRSKAFKEQYGDQPWSKAGQMEELLKRETDPDLVGAGTYDVGNRLFTMEGEIINRPDLNLAFPYQVTGEDLGMKFMLAPKEKAMRDWMKQYEGRLGKTGKPAPVSYMDLARNQPSQFVSDDYLTFLQKEGYKKGGKVNKKGKVHFSDTADAMRAELKSKRK
jgi:hypothetical protein